MPHEDEIDNSAMRNGGNIPVEFLEWQRIMAEAAKEADDTEATVAQSVSGFTRVAAYAYIGYRKTSNPIINELVMKELKPFMDKNSNTALASVRYVVSNYTPENARAMLEMRTWMVQTMELMELQEKGDDLAIKHARAWEPDFPLTFEEVHRHIVDDLGGIFRAKGILDVIRGQKKRASEAAEKTKEDELRRYKAQEVGKTPAELKAEELARQEDEKRKKIEPRVVRQLRVLAKTASPIPVVPPEPEKEFPLNTCETDDDAGSQPSVEPEPMVLGYCVDGSWFRFDDAWQLYLSQCIIAKG